VRNISLKQIPTFFFYCLLIPTFPSVQNLLGNKIKIKYLVVHLSNHKEKRKNMNSIKTTCTILIFTIFVGDNIEMTNGGKYSSYII